MSDELMRALVDDLLPPGALWLPEDDEGFDQLLDAISQNSEEVRIFLATLASIRDPLLTPILEDLEREYGILSDDRLSEETRRMRLNTFVFKGQSSGSEDNLQNVLRDAGFDVLVYQNDPAVDPAILLDQSFQMVAAGFNAFAGRADAFAGRLGGELLVNGAIFSTLPDYLPVAGNLYAGDGQTAGEFDDMRIIPFEYQIPTDPDAWPFIFFVGGARTITLAASSWAEQTADGAFAGDFNAIAFGNGVFVAVGTGGEIQTSAQGVTWAQETAAGAFAGDFEAVAFSSTLGLFVAVGTGGEIQTSPDGSAWTQRTAAGAFAGIFNGVAFGFGKFIAVGTGGEIQSSADGITWAQETAAGAFAGVFNAVVFNLTQTGSNLFVAVGAGGEIQSSADGITWAQETADVSYSGDFLSAAAKSGLFVIAGTGGEIQTATDGSSWIQRIPAVIPGRIEGLSFGNDLFVLVGETGEIQTSPDGITWTQQAADGSFTDDFFAVEFGNDRFIAVGELAEIQLTSGIVVVDIENAEIPNERREEFERTILRYKPLFTWAALIVTYT